MKTFLITGSCGFIGSNLALRLLGAGNIVIGVDRRSARHANILWELKKHKNFKHYYDLELSEPGALDVIKEEVDFVFHLAANADVRFSSKFPEKDLSDGIVSTYNVLRWMYSRGIKKIAYASTAALYGDPTVIPTPETYPFVQTSFYGASKVAGEALIQAHCSSYDAQAWVFRYCSITGPRYSHGYIYNFYRALKEDPKQLYIHGGKNQRKTYVDVEDCIDAMLLAIEKANNTVNTFNIGHDETISLPESIPVIATRMGVEPELVWSGNEVGWVGDSKISHLDNSRLKSLGWNPTYSITQSIIRTVDWLEDNKWIISVRKEI